MLQCSPETQTAATRYPILREPEDKDSCGCNAISDWLAACTSCETDLDTEERARGDELRDVLHFTVGARTHFVSAGLVCVSA